MLMPYKYARLIENPSAGLFPAVYGSLMLLTVQYFLWIGIILLVNFFIFILAFIDRRQDQAPWDYCTLLKAKNPGLLLGDVALLCN